MKGLVRVMLLLLCLSMLASCLVACKDDSGDTSGDEQPTRKPTNEETADESGWVYTSPGKLYNNDEFNIYTWSGTNEWVLDVDETTTPIDSETFYHFCNVEEEIGVIFNIAQSVSGGWGQHTNFIAKVAMLTGADNIDLVCQYSLAADTGVLYGVYHNLMELDYLDWDAPYWSDELRNANTINGKMFYTTGEVTRSALYNMFIMVYNYSMATSYEMGDLYALVKSGKWTVAKLRELTTNVYQDLNNNEVPDVGDRFGLVSAKNCIDPFQYGCDLPLIKISEMGELEINAEVVRDYGVGITDALIDLFHTNPGAYVGSNVNPEYTQPIESGNVVFASYTAASIINSLYATEINYGILPFPKYTEEQKDYYTTLGMTYSILSVPVIASDPNQAAAVMEALAHDAYTYLTPYIYEESLKSRYSKRPEDAEMFDILRGGIVYDPGRLFGSVDIFSLIRSTVAANDSLVGRYDGNVDTWKRRLGDITFAFS